MAKTQIHHLPRLRRARRFDQFVGYPRIPVLSDAALARAMGRGQKFNPRRHGAMIAKRAIVAAFPTTWEEDNTSVVDLLANVRHLCDASGLDYGALDREAYAHYCAEVYATDEAFLPALESGAR